MKKLIILLFSALVFGACTKEVPNPLLPDVSTFPVDAIKSFSLISPSTGSNVTVYKSDIIVSIDWSDSEGATMYEWVADLQTGDFSTPKLVVPADNNGKDSKLTLTYTQLDDALAAAGVKLDESVDYKWSVRAKTGSTIKLATTPRNITLKREGPVDVTFSVAVPANTPASYEVYFAGEFGFITGDNWQEPGSTQSQKLKFTKNANGTYSLTLSLFRGKSFEYKYFIAPAGGTSWGNGERFPNSNGVGTNGPPNRKFTFSGSNRNVNHAVSFWEGYDYDYVMYDLTAPANTPADRYVFVAGQFNKIGAAPSEWQQPGTNPTLVMTNSSGQKYFIVFPKPASNVSLEYKYFVSSTSSPTWDNGSEGSNKVFNFTGSNLVQSDVVNSWSNL